MAWTVTVGEGGTAYTISSSASFELTFTPVVNDDGTIDYVQGHLVIKGDLIAASASTVADNFVDLTELATDQTVARRVKITQDGTDKYDIQPSQILNGPFVTRAGSLESAGNGTSHWLYELELEWKDLGNENVYELQLYVSTQKTSGKVTRKIWKATCKAGTLSTALSKVLTYKPSEPYVTEEVEKWAKDRRAAATWVWEGQRTSNGILSIECEVDYGPGGLVDYVEQPQAGVDKNPLLFRRRRSVQEVRILYLIRSFSDQIALLPAHFAESQTLRRATGRERQHDVKVENAEKGIYRRIGEEVWLNTGATTIQANHNGHDKIVFLTEPGDGGAGG